MEAFSALLAPCEGNPLVNGGFSSQRPVTQSFYVFFDLRLNKRLRKQSRRQWFETHHTHYDVSVMAISNTGSAAKVFVRHIEWRHLVSKGDTESFQHTDLSQQAYLTLLSALCLLMACRRWRQCLDPVYIRGRNVDFVFHLNSVYGMSLEFHKSKR